MLRKLYAQSAVLAFVFACLTANVAMAQTTAFTYQGKLNNNGGAGAGTYDFEFRLFDVQMDGAALATQQRLNVAVNEGVFTVSLDFGAGAFDGSSRWLEIAVRPAGTGTFTTLNPRQSVTSTPYSIRSSTATTADTAASATTAATADNALQLDGVPAANFLRLDANGNLGIGESNPATRVAISGGPLWTSAGWTSSLSLDNGSALGWQANASGQRFGLGQSGGGLYFFRTNSPLGDVSNPANYDMIISDAGNVGIGVAPAAGLKLDVLGNARFQTANGNINFGSPNTETGLTFTNANRADIRFDALGLKLFAGAGTNIPSNGVVINTNGNVGIGTLTPASKLDVRGHLTLEAGGSPAIYTSAATSEQNRFLNLINSPTSPSASGLKAGGILVADSYSFANPGKNDLVVKGNVTIGDAPLYSNKLTVISTTTANAVYAVGGFTNSIPAGDAMVARGGNSNGGSAGRGLFAIGGDGNFGGAAIGAFGGNGVGNGATGGNGISALGGSGSRGGVGVLATGGESSNGEGGEGLVVRGGDTTAAGQLGGFGIVVSPGSGPAGRHSAGVFNGNVTVNGTLSKFGGSFKIDHPLDPPNKYLYHSFVESPDMMNIYNGNATTDENGNAIVRLPDYFQALNRDFRYQLTVIGQFAQAIVAEEIRDNQFTIKTDKPNVKVSWQVTGIRHDAFANDNRIPVEEDKPEKERGLYLYPQGFNQPVEKSVWEQHPELMRLSQPPSQPVKAQPQ